MNKTFIAILIIAVITVAFLYKNSAPKAVVPVVEKKEEQKVVTPAPKTTVTPKVTPSAPVVAPVPEIPRLVVSYTDQGFSPSIREVSKGEEVMFVNNSSRGMRIASYQINNNGYYSGLSQPRTVARGEVFKFTFLESGAWNYHNLNYENHTGIVVVK